MFMYVCSYVMCVCTCVRTHGICVCTSENTPERIITIGCMYICVIVFGTLLSEVRICICVYTYVHVHKKRRIFTHIGKDTKHANLPSIYMDVIVFGMLLYILGNGRCFHSKHDDIHRYTWLRCVFCVYMDVIVFGMLLSEVRTCVCLCTYLYLHKKTQHSASIPLPACLWMSSCLECCCLRSTPVYACVHM